MKTTFIAHMKWSGGNEVWHVITIEYSGFPLADALGMVQSEISRMETPPVHVEVIRADYLA